MRWPGASPRPKKLPNYAVCWMNMKGAGDDRFDEFCFSQCDAIFGMGSVAFSLAGNRSRRAGRGCNGFVSSRVVAISVRCRGTAADAAGSGGYILVLFAAALLCYGNRESIVVQACLADRGE